MVIIKFKSTKKNFDKECSGTKNNTLREVDYKDERFKLLLDWETGADYTIKIDIVGAKNSFRREISDVTFWKGWCIISW